MAMLDLMGHGELSDMDGFHTHPESQPRISLVKTLLIRWLLIC